MLVTYLVLCVRLTDSVDGCWLPIWCCVSVRLTVLMDVGSIAGCVGVYVGLYVGLYVCLLVCFSDRQQL